MTSSSGSVTRSDHSRAPIRPFRQELDQIRQRLGLRWQDLAESAEVSQQQLSDLRRNDPSLVVLRGLWKALQEEDAPVELIRMAVMGVATDLLDSETRAVLDCLPVSFSQKVKIQDSSVSTRCVVSDTTGERYDPDVLGDTLSQMRDYRTEHFFFSPFARSEKRQVYAFSEKAIPKSTKVLDSYAYFIQAPRVLFFVRLQIDNIGTPSQQAYYSLGPRHAAVVVKAEPSEVEQMRQVLGEVVLRIQAGERDIRMTDEPNGMDLKFDVVT